MEDPEEVQGSPKVWGRGVMAEEAVGLEPGCSRRRWVCGPFQQVLVGQASSAGRVPPVEAQGLQGLVGQLPYWLVGAL